jgi:hypothetical protein
MKYSKGSGHFSRIKNGTRTENVDYVIKVNLKQFRMDWNSSSI